MFDEPVLRKWMGLEISRINDGVVKERKRLSLLLTEETPSAMTRSGREYLFDRAVLRDLGDTLPPDLHRTLRLPILFYFDMEVSDSCFLDDSSALAAFQVLGDLSPKREMVDGRVWVGRAIVFSLLRKYPTAVQIMMH